MKLFSRRKSRFKVVVNVSIPAETVDVAAMAEMVRAEIARREGSAGGGSHIWVHA